MTDIAYVLNLINLQARALKVSPGAPGGAGPVPSPPAKQKLPPMDSKNAQQTDEILNSILPPRSVMFLNK